jgi:hypothetical protein
LQTKKLIVLSFYIITSVLSVIAVLSPWWRISTTREEEIAGNGKIISGEYWLTQVVTASKVGETEDETVHVTVPFANMSTNEENVNALGLLCTTTLTCSAVALSFNLLTLAFMILSIILHKKSFLSFGKYTAIIASLLFLVAIAYFAFEAEPIISKLENILPSDIYAFEGSEILSFWGGIEMASSSGLYEWIWGPALGWFSAFIAFIMNGLAPLFLKDLKKFETGKALNIF